ncbi:MAG: hypothetical protein ISS88_01530 [Candidatus Portnoybacteria bacterium]|nr:hypothetical protein [Candidatus Portnoybacteria bacterium]
MKIPVQVKKGQSAEKVTEEMKVDLRNGLAAEQKQPSRKWLFLGIGLFLIIVFSILSYWFFSSQKMPLADLVPEEAVIFGLINQPELYPQILPFSQFLGEENFYGQGAINKFNDYFNQAQLNFQEDIQPLFKPEMAFILLPGNSETSFPFILLLEKKGSTAQISRILDKIEPKLREDYNFSSPIYRQIEITILRPLSSTINYLYSQVGDYFIISNSQESLEEMIDFIIEK